MIEENVARPGGLDLFLRSWRAAGSARGIVVIVPGFNAHGGYYLWVAEQLAAIYLSVHVLDLRGRGRSAGERFYVESFDDYVGDVADIVTRVKSREPGLPVFLLGHSAGGVVSCLYALDHPDALAGLVCESFAYRLPAPDFVLAAFKGLNHLAPHAHVLELHNEDFSRNPDAVLAMNRDALIAHEKQPIQTLAAMVRADDRLTQEFPRITLPLLILHGTGDKAAKASGSQFFFDTAGSADKTLKLYEGHFHDLLNDTGKEVVMNDIVEWIDERLASKREGAFR